jgi:hypothetical protein
MKVAQYPAYATHTRDCFSIKRKGPSRRDFMKVAHHFSGGLTFILARPSRRDDGNVSALTRRDARKKTVIDRP